MSSARTNAISTRNGSSRKNDPLCDSFLRRAPATGASSTVVVLSSLITATLTAAGRQKCRAWTGGRVVRPSGPSSLRQLARGLGRGRLVALQHGVLDRRHVVLRSRSGR